MNIMRWLVVGLLVGICGQAQEEAVELVVSPPELTIEEGGVGTFTVRLSAPPKGSFKAKVEFRDCRARIRLNARINSVSFTRENWDQEQTLTLAAVWDENTTNDACSVRVVPLGRRDIQPALVKLTEADQGLPPGPVHYLYPQEATTDGGSRVTVLGGALTRDTRVTVGGAPAKVKFYGNGWLSFEVPPHDAGLVEIVFENDEIGRYLMRDAFRYSAPLQLDLQGVKENDVIFSNKDMQLKGAIKGGKGPYKLKVYVDGKLVSETNEGEEKPADTTGEE